MRIDWLYEKYEDDSELWETDYRGYQISVSRDSTLSGDQVYWSVIGSDDISVAKNFSLAQAGAVRWINQTWSEWEDTAVDN